MGFKSKSFTLDKEEIKLFLEHLMNETGIGKNLSQDQKEHLIERTIDNLDRAGIELNRDNFEEKEFKKTVIGLLISLKATLDNVPNFDFKIAFKDPKQLTPEEKQKLQPIDIAIKDSLEEAVNEKELNKNLDNAPNPSQIATPRPTPGGKSKETLVTDENGNVVDKMAPQMTARGQSNTVTVTNLYSNDAVDEIHRLESSPVFGPVLDAAFSFSSHHKLDSTQQALTLQPGQG